MSFVCLIFDWGKEVKNEHQASPCLRCLTDRRGCTLVRRWFWGADQMPFI